MAGTPTVTREVIAGRQYLTVTLSETSVTASNEWSAPLEYVGPITMVSLRATLTSGAGATIQPVLGRAASFVAATVDEIAAVENAAANISEAAQVPWYSTGTIYGRAIADTGTDNAVSWEIVLAVGAP